MVIELYADLNRKLGFNKHNRFNFMLYTWIKREIKLETKLEIKLEIIYGHAWGGRSQQPASEFHVEAAQIRRRQH